MNAPPPLRDAPMLKADDAIELDTADMSVDEAVREAIRLVEEALGRS